MKRSTWFSLLVLSASFSVPAQAQAQVQDDARLPLWEVGVIAGAVSTPAYPGAAERSNRALAAPMIIYRGKVFRSDQSGVNARLLRSEVFELDVGFAASLPSRSDAGPARAGMPDLGTLLEAGPRLRINLFRPTPLSRVRLDLPVRSVLEARGGLRNQGLTFEPRLAYEMRAQDGLWSGDAYLAAVWGNRKINGYFYDVAPRYATVERPAYEADSGLILTRVGLSGSRKVNEDLRLFGFVRYESYSGAANRASPLMKRSSGSSAGIGLAWTLRRSERRAAAN